MTVGALWHESSLVHDNGRGHPERRERVEAIRAQLDRAALTGRLDWRSPEPASRALLELAHDPAYVEALHGLDAAGGAQLDPDTRMGPGSLDATLRASQAAVDACARVLSGEWESAFSLMRPPGHHATPGQAMGFCLTNHAAIAARWAVRESGARRVLICDWDAHHGNGTQDVFWTDADVLYVSLHQYPYYPGTGAVDEIGEGPGRGTTLNVPLPAGSGEDVYARALDEVILPVARRFEPELTIVSAGYDAHAADPLCMMRLSAGSYFRFARRLAGLGRGPVCLLEGGYDLDGLAWSASATASALLGDAEPADVPPGELAERAGAPDGHRWVDQAARIWGKRPL